MDVNSMNEGQYQRQKLLKHIMDVNSMNEGQYQRQKLLKHMKEQVTLLKETTQKETGSFKYDFAYDEMLALISKYNA